jgi:AraC-like DNA-binding protein
MKPFIETVVRQDGESWAFLDRRLAAGIPFEWHCHPEYELTLTLNSLGHRYIGDDVDSYADGDLVLIGPSIAHSWQSQAIINDAEPHVALVAWFTHEWAERLFDLMPEFRGLEALMNRARCGVAFSHAARDKVRPLMLAMRNAPPAQRTLLLLSAIEVLIADRDAENLTNNLQEDQAIVAQDPRLIRVLNHLHHHFTEAISLDQLAEMACVSTSALQRIFRRQARMTVIDYVIRLRIGRACSMLIHESTAIATIAAEVGYSNMALFNRHFLRLKGNRPSAFRKLHRFGERPELTPMNEPGKALNLQTMPQ